MSFTDKALDEAIKIAAGGRAKEAPGQNHNGGRGNDSGRTSAAEKSFVFTLAKNITLEPKEFLIEGFLGRYEVSAFYGPPDSAKSIVMVHAQASVAAGIEFCGRRVMQGPCLYVAAERGAIVKRRVLAWCREHAAPEIPLAVVDHAIDLRTGKIDADRIVATAQELGSHCGHPVVWVAFDTLNRILSGGDENSSKDMGAVMASIDHIHRETAAHVSVIHHVPVDRTDRMRGHSLTLGAVDQANRITRDGLVRVDVDKANDLVDKPTFSFEIRSVTLHVDAETGTETSAPVLVAVPAAAAKPKGRAARMPKAMQTAMRALHKAVDEAGTVPPASNNIPHNIRVVSFDQWRQYAYASGISTGEERARQKAFQRASEWLIGEGGLVGAWNE
jgi:hypothetical protein